MRNMWTSLRAVSALILGICGLGFCALGGAKAADGAPKAPSREDEVRKALSSEEVCSAIGREAAEHDLPQTFFTRLIWQESRFDPRAVSHKGARGIAQFMPGTARWRGLDDAYDALASLREAAKWLGELRQQFGNLGLAAAAYNAGPGRVRAWLDGKSALPAETRRYVRIVTGWTADEWSRRPRDQVQETQASMSCLDIVNTSPRVPKTAAVVPGDGGEASQPWGLQLLGAWSQTQAIEGFRRLQQRFSSVIGDRRPLIVKSRVAGRGRAAYYRVRIAESTRDSADRLCARLSAAGGACVVFRN